MASDLYLPEEVTTEILTKLPVKSLLRFRCVSKSWCAVMINLDFIAKHLGNKKEKNGSLLVHNFVSDAERYAFAVYPDKNLTVPVFEYLGPKLKEEARLLGPRNGIFCMFNWVGRLALWNPATREFRTLPVPPKPDNNIIPRRLKFEKPVFGFGLDPFTNDHKIVSIEIYQDYRLDDIRRGCYHKHIAVYSMRDDSWKEFTGDFPKCYVCRSYTLHSYMDGVYYWYAEEKNYRQIYLAFHMGYEVFQVILQEGGRPEPPMFQGFTGDIVDSRFGVYKNSLVRIDS